MGRLISLSAMAVLAITSSIARADDGACRSVQSGQGYVTVLDRDEQWTYVLQPLGPRWQISPPDRHSAGHVFCADCASTSTSAGDAFLWFGASPQSSAVKRPLTALERSERRTELIAGWALHRNQLETRDVREAVSFGPLSGYAVLYHWSMPHIPERNEPAAIVGSLIVIAVKDACVVFDASITSKRAADGNDWMPLDSLLSEVVIEKRRGAG